MTAAAADRGGAAEPAACDYCGLPLASADGAGPRYCCFGCRFAAGVTGAGGAEGAARWTMARLGAALFFTMNVMVFTMLLWSQPATDAGSPAAAVLYGLARHACLLFSAPVLVLLGGPLLAAAADELRRGRPALNLLLAVGVAAAFLLSVHAVAIDRGHVYFEVSCMVLVAVTLGRWLEANGKLRTTAALRELGRLLPDRVRRLGTAGEAEVELAAVRPGDDLRVLPGERIPADGQVRSGGAAIDEQVVTGESVPVVKGPGAVVYSGTAVIDGPLVIRVSAAPGAGTLERLIAAATRAAATGGRQQRLADRAAAWFLPAVLAVAVAALVGHAWRAGWSADGFTAGTLAAIAVVVVSCPCALGLATPLALWAAIGAAARRGVLVRDGDALARLAGATRFCFDKTGTLTTGCRVHEVVPAAAGDAREVLAVAAGLATDSTHVLARAIQAAAAEAGVAPAAVTASRATPGLGVEGTLADGRPARLGSGRWMAGAAGDADDDAERPTCLVAVAGMLLGRIEFAESLRPEAGPALAVLARRGAELWLLSGDRLPRARRVAEALGMQCRAPLLPDEKLGHAAGAVMVGDGINDAPALAAADVGVALGCGADVSRWTAAVCLLGDDLGTLPWLVDLAVRTTRTVRWNLLWAFGYNAACVPLAAAGWFHPALAAAAMVASSLFVVSGSLALTRDAADGPEPAAARPVGRPAPLAPAEASG